MLADAAARGYAVCYCESWNLESIEAVVEAAEECDSPIIAGFNGGFLRHSSRRKPENLSYYAGFSVAIERSRVPVAFLLNESDSLDQMREAIELGFNAVMPENEGLSFEEYRELVKRAVALAHARGLWVEAQLGILPDGGTSRDGGSHNGHRAEITDPDAARSFVEQTGVDALAVSIGNVHVLTAGKVAVDLEALHRIREKVKVPLVLHGGSSLQPEIFQDLVRLGVAKFNFGTLLKQAYLDAVRERLATYARPLNPHLFLGVGGRSDIMVAGREAVKAKVKELLHACGSAGRQNYDFSEPVSRGSRQVHGDAAQGRHSGHAGRAGAIRSGRFRVE
jgi:fructose-bisphosphate aldolase class II